MAASWVFYAAVLLAPVVALLLKALSSHHRRRRLNLPPGPKPWPIIGNLNLMGSLPHRTMLALSKKYGPVMRLKFGSIPVVVMTSVETAKLALKTHDFAFASRPKTSIGKYIFYGYNDIGTAPYGPHWRLGRKLCLMELFSDKRIDSFEYIRVEEVKSMISDLFASAGNPVSLRQHFTSNNLNIISRMAIGGKYLTSAEASVELREAIRELFFLGGVFNIGDFIPWLDFLDLQGYVKRMKAVNKTFDMFIETVLEDHEARRRGAVDFTAKDIVDVLLDLSHDPKLDPKLTRTNAKALTLEMIVGGSDTTSVILEWAMAELFKRPETMTKAVEELNEVVGKERWVQEKDLPDLPYLEAILKETMRLHPVGPLLAPHCCQEDCNVAGYDISIGTMVMVNVWAIGRDPEIWEFPDEFRPERFMEKEIDMMGQDFALLPFGSGRRMCPGNKLGMKMVQPTLANILHGFEWTLPQNTSAMELDMAELFGISTPMKIPLVAVAKPRLPAHLYS